MNVCAYQLSLSLSYEFFSSSQMGQTVLLKLYCSKKKWKIQMKTEFHARKVNSNESGWTIWNQPYWIIRSGRCNPFKCIELEFDAVRHAINSMLKWNWSRDQLAERQQIDTNGSIMCATTNERWFTHVLVWDIHIMRNCSTAYQIIIKMFPIRVFK